ncbi:F0F1 ATP synthase subunit delta [Microbacterium mitrae]|uniref:ATP synthase subunit delta n=1 Tax=Microbacterium mitrae TaxID=664640 RepID=A0A5C8HM56_9MICO|nr:F0F1 ATP synthase subunit delta [Microbacterium mitrae]TXK04578.1 F0F1 ATP synthase subunit delta [Microbacterium mitrae]
MGSATTQALAAAAIALDAQTVDLETARELFTAAQVIGSSKQLCGALADPTASVASRSRVVATVFGAQFQPATIAALTAAVSLRWSNPADLVAGIEDLGVRAASRAAEGVDLEGELFSVSRVIAENPALELALGSRLGQDEAKGALIEKLLAGKASEVTTLVVSSLVQDPRGRRVRSMLSHAMRLVAQQRGGVVATVTSASALSAEQQERLTVALSKNYGGRISLNVVIDPAVVGGLRVQIADDVIDGTISSRIEDLRQKLAG